MKFRRSIQLPGKSCAASKIELKIPQRKSKKLKRKSLLANSPLIATLGRMRKTMFGRVHK